VIAEMAELSENLGELVLNDVLIVNRYIISSSEQVVGTTDQNHRNYTKTVKSGYFLDNHYLDSAWCLAETGQYTDPQSNCVVIVYGMAELKPGADFLASMDAGYRGDLPLIESIFSANSKRKMPSIM
jgi:hypothetical protein